MGTAYSARYCRCGARLAGDNESRLCSRCQRHDRDLLCGAPEVFPDFWQLDLLRDALESWHMGKVIRAYRVHPWHGCVLSQTVVAGWAHMTQTQLSRLENGPPPKDLDKLTRWVEILHIPENLLWFKVRQDDGIESNVPARTARPALKQSAVVGAPKDRATVGASNSPAIGRNLTASESADLVGHLRQQWHMLVRADNLLGPRYALTAVQQQLAVLTDVLPMTRGVTRKELVQLAAQYAESASWLHEDVGDSTHAQQLVGAATEWAHEAGDHHMLAWTLFRRSQQAARNGDAAQTIDLIHAAQHRAPRLPAPMRAALAQQEAHGHALNGDDVTTHRLFEQAMVWAASDTHGDAREGHGSFCTEHYLKIQHASCYAQLGQPRRAVSAYETALPTLPSAYRRDRGVALASFAAACVSVDEPERAAEMGQQALGIARSSGSLRTEHIVIDVARHLTACSHLESVGALLHDLRTSASV